MALLDWFAGRAPSLDSPAPPIRATDAARARGIEIRIGDHDDAPEAMADPARRYIIEPYYSMIEYRDASGTVTRRRVTMRSVTTRGNTALLHALCHERQALRTFRIDRIAYLISQDGEVEDAAPWFAEVLAASEFEDMADQPARHPARDTSDAAPSISPYTALRRELGAAIPLLVASARSDDYLHPREIETILTYAEDVALAMRDAGHLPGGFDSAIFDKLERTIRRLRPTRDDVTAAFAAIGTLSARRLAAFARAMATCAAADGRVDEIERGLLDELNTEGARHHGFGWND